MLRQLQAWYPDPPRVLFVSNNEASKLRWVDAESDQRYLDLYGVGRSDEFKREAFADAWRVRYRALQSGFRDGLAAPAWKANARFIAYEAFGPPFYGRWDGWAEYALPVTGRIDPSPLTWDGGSPDFYLADFAGPNADFRVMSPQVEAMNWPFMLAEARRLNPSFWFEFSSWSGGAGMQAYFASLGQSFTPERYGAMVRFGLGLMRPRLVREYPFSNSRGPTSVDEPWFRPVIDAVDAVHANPVQRRFWQDSALVAVRSRQHQYQSAIPAEYASADRMVLLPTDLDPAAPWTIDTALPVLALARVAGASPRREWLVYTQAPTGDRRGVTLTIPDYGAVRVDVPVGGALWLVREADGAVLPVGDGPTGSG